MAVEHIFSDEFLQSIETKPASMVHASSWHGRLRVAYFNKLTGVAGDADSTLTLVRLPAGRVRVLKDLSKLVASAGVATATLDVGFKEYTQPDGVIVAAEEDAFVSAFDVATGGKVLFDEAAATVPTRVFDTRDGLDIVAKWETAGFADDDTIEGYVVYVLD